jgi:hypothetical protein
LCDHGEEKRARGEVKSSSPSPSLLLFRFMPIAREQPHVAREQQHVAREQTRENDDEGRTVCDFWTE